MTREEISRFALQLREAERIRAMIASEEAAFADEPVLVALAEENPPVAA